MLVRHGDHAHTASHIIQAGRDVSDGSKEGIGGRRRMLLIAARAIRCFGVSKLLVLPPQSIPR